MLVRLTDGGVEGSPILESNFLMLYPTVSFPRPLQPEDLEPFGYGLYEYTSVPTASHHYKKVVEAPPVKNEATGVWMQSWTEQDMNDEEKAEADSYQSMRIREVRNNKLAACDYTQVSDYPRDGSSWHEYRQSLRDIPQQDGFPWDNNWPEEPV